MQTKSEEDKPLLLAPLLCISKELTQEEDNKYSLHCKYLKGDLMKSNINKPLASVLNRAWLERGVSANQIILRLSELGYGKIDSLRVRFSNLKMDSRAMFRRDKELNKRFNRDLCKILTDILGREIRVEDLFEEE